jgi:cyclin H
MTITDITAKSSGTSGVNDSSTEEKTPRKTITDDDLYRHSSQFRLWSFTKKDLLEKKKICHQRAAERISQNLQNKGIDDIERLTLEEENELVIFYASKIGEICRMFNMPSQVKASAVSYFRKFYLVYSVMDYHPKNILYTTVFLASKAENYFISIDKFCQALLRTEPKDILSLEFLLLQSLSFTLMVQNAIAPLHGFFLDMQVVLPDEKSHLGKLHDDARAIVVDGLISDSPFLYTPPQIALAALYSASEEITLKYIDKTFPAEQKDLLVTLIKESKNDLLNVQLPSSERGKAIDKKLHMCLNPDKKRKKRSPPAPAGPEDQALKRLKTDASTETSSPIASRADTPISSVIQSAVPDVQEDAN